MINLWYNDYYSPGVTRGPVKVIQNLIRSLDDCGISYSLNEETYEHNFMVCWDVSKYNSLKNKKSLLIGPQFWPWGFDFNQLGEYSKIIVPSEWVSDLFKKYFPEVKTLVWPVAIYPPNINNDIQFDCLVYYKNRSKEDLEKVLSYLDNKKITYVGLEYGNYNQNEFKEVLGQVKYCVILDNTESQGIAIQEMMALNKPLFVWDQIEWDYMGNDYIFPATSIPYWSVLCGKSVKTFIEFEKEFDEFLYNLDDYCPKDIIDKKLSPQKSIDILIKHYSK